MKLRHLYLSAAHNFYGHHGQAPGDAPMVEVAELQVMARQGIVGDRFFGFKENYKGQVTFFASEVYEKVKEMLGVHDKAPSVFRRNIITEGQDLNALIGLEFEIQGVRFLGMEECAPCHWMNHAFAPGAEASLKKNGGLRATVLTNGTLRQDAPTDATG